jgi:DNA-binding XRE family transcriptional regulator
MANSDFWRDLAISFQSASKLYDFTVYRQYYMEISTTEPTWEFAPNPEFDALARRGATMLTPPPTGDLAVAWLEALWKEATHGPVRSPSEVLGKDRSGRLTRLRGKIDLVFQASSALCRNFESAALQAEFEEKHRGDPRNWSQLRQQYEAFKSIKELHNEPAERIPEEFVRNAIARIRGIKPEEVTPEQIRFEVAGLLPFYHRIELIPSVPKPESPPVAETKQEYAGIEPTRNGEKPESVQSYVPDTIAAQLQRLRRECNWSAEKLAEAVRLNPRTVARHLSGETTPHLRNISAYERVFSKQLKRRVVVNKMP